MTLDELNAAPRDAFVAALGSVFENAEWVAEEASGVRPFPTVAALHQALFDEVADAPESVQIDFLNGHPDLAGALARQRQLTAHSTAEQSALGLDRLDEAGFARFEAMNDRYRARFGFPFLICVRRHTLGSLLASFDRRLRADPAAELATALLETFWITRLRVAALVQGPGMPEVAGVLSTHVLDTSRGRAADGVLVELYEVGPGGPVLLRTGVTNPDGRVVPALIDDGGPLRAGSYELRFHVGDYFARDTPGFLDIVPVRIGITEPEAHYHVPLLVSPFGYTTYRGS